MPKKTKTNPKKTKSDNTVTKKSGFASRLKSAWRNRVSRIKALVSRRPHRSFQRTYRRDYIRSLRLPGYWAFTGYVYRTLLGQKKLFLGLAGFYALLTVLLVGLTSQENYTQLSEIIRDAGEELSVGNFSELENAGLVLVNIATGTLNVGKTEAQGIYAALLGVLVWLTTVWLLRVTMAGQRPRLRDGLYNAGAPLVSTLMVALALLFQLLPVVLAIIAYGAAASTGLLNAGVEAMVFWAGASLLGLLSLYWISSTLFGLIVVTLPGMYPWRAIVTSGDLVVGRRIRLMLRVVWLLLTIIVIWALIMIPLILLDAWIKGLWPVIEWIPVIPVALVAVASFTVVWSSAYMYLLYRKVVDDDSAPA